MTISHLITYARDIVDNINYVTIACDVRHRDVIIY